MVVEMSVCVCVRERESACVCERERESVYVLRSPAIAIEIATALQQGGVCA